MKKLQFKKIDVFTEGGSAGNPAGYILLEHPDQLSQDEMQRVAMELKGFVSEVGFVHKRGEEYGIKYFSSECEVAFCGHVTIAIMNDLLRNDEDVLDKDKVFININAEKLSVYNHLKDENAVYIMAPDPKFLECHVNMSEIGKALSIDSSVINRFRPVKVIEAGLKTLIVSIKTLSDCLEIFPDQEALRLFCLNNGIDIVHISTKETYLDNCSYRTRVFAPKFGYLEDPATGSGNAAFGYYLIAQGLWKDEITIEQGFDKYKPNIVKLKRKLIGEKKVLLFGGSSVTRVQGTYFIHN